jgi:hypothetical protein
LRLVFEHEYFLGWAVCPLMTSFFVSFHWEFESCNENFWILDTGVKYNYLRALELQIFKVKGSNPVI